MKRQIILFIVAIFFVITGSLNAAHIVGGEISYKCIDPVSYTYEITLKLYRNCAFQSPPTIPFADSVIIGIYDNDSLKIDIFPIGIKLKLPPIDTLTNYTYNKCKFSHPDVCVEQAAYQTYVNLPPRPGGYLLMYQQCCRIAAIANIINPLSVGASWILKVPDTANGGCNSSASFGLDPPSVICANEQLSYNHFAVDSDGDSLVYSLCNVMNGDFVEGAQPPPPDTIPNFPIGPYVSGFRATNPLGGNDSLQIDPVTGLLTGIPPIIGQFVVGVCVAEYRNGTLLSINKRDFQYNVVDCDTTVNALFTYNTDVCSNDYTTNFINQSQTDQGWPLIGATYHWDFGISGTTTDTSNLENPSYTYPDSGFYDVTLTVNRGLSCEDSIKQTIELQSLIETTPVTISINGDTMTASYGVSFQWFVNGILISGATNQTYIALTPGYYFVTIIDGNGCEVTSDMVTWTGLPNINIQDKVSLFPNPNNGHFELWIISPNNNHIPYRIMNITGQQIAAGEITRRSDPFSKKIDMSRYGKGIFLLQLITGDGVINRKIVIQ